MSRARFANKAHHRPGKAAEVEVTESKSEAQWGPGEEATATFQSVAQQQLGMVRSG